MKIISPQIEIISPIDGNYILRFLERCGRISYKSEDKITSESSRKFLEMIIKNGHLSVIEHFAVSVKIICDRGVSHELVRHRIASYTQESTRYCNYSKSKFGSELTVIKPCYFNENSEGYFIWAESIKIIEANYIRLLNLGHTPQEARSILPNSLKTEIITTMNLREWRHFFELRCSPNAHPQMQEIASMILMEFNKKIPIIFEDL